MWNSNFKAFSNLEELYLDYNEIDDFVTTTTTKGNYCFLKIYVHEFKSIPSFIWYVKLSILLCL